MAIPAFNHLGVLPPYLADAIGNARSPYAATMEDVVGRFATSEDRRAILNGLLDYRAALGRELGLVDGIQWLDGSFVEDIEASENRPPADVDVVTIAAFPALSTLEPEQRKLLEASHTRATFRCDAYPVDVGRTRTMNQLIDHITYWFGVFGHRRDGQWKGLVAVPLDAAADARARAVLGAP